MKLPLPAPEGTGDRAGRTVVVAATVAVAVRLLGGAVWFARRRQLRD